MKTALILTSLFSAGMLGLSACAPVEGADPMPGPGDQTAFKPCKVEDYQSYVGRNRSTIPAAPAGRPSASCAPPARPRWTIARTG